MGLWPTKSDEDTGSGWRGINDLRRVFNRAVLLSRDYPIDKRDVY